MHIEWSINCSENYAIQIKTDSLLTSSLSSSVYLWGEYLSTHNAISLVSLMSGTRLPVLRKLDIVQINQNQNFKNFNIATLTSGDLIIEKKML